MQAKLLSKRGSRNLLLFVGIAACLVAIYFLKIQ